MIRINKVHKIWRQSRDVLAGLAFIATGLGCTASDAPIALESQTSVILILDTPFGDIKLGERTLDMILGQDTKKNNTMNF